MTPSLAEILGQRWLHVRSMSYDFLDVLKPDDLNLKLPFPESQSIGYQFWCMVGASESYLKHLEHGEWQGFASSLDTADDPSPSGIKAIMQKTDTQLIEQLGRMDLYVQLKSGEPSYEVVQLMIEHEMHHQGQLINLMYCHHLPIPRSWADTWALSYA